MLRLCWSDERRPRSHWSFARLAIALPVDGLYTYKVPMGLELKVGHTVSVSFGRQRVSAYVIELTDTADFPKVKEIDRLLDLEPAPARLVETGECG